MTEKVSCAAGRRGGNAARSCRFLKPSRKAFCPLDRGGEQRRWRCTGKGGISLFQKEISLPYTLPEKISIASEQLKDCLLYTSSLKSASRRGLTERFDSTVGAFSLLMPFVGKTQRSPSQAMAALLPVLPGSKTEQGSVICLLYTSSL